VVIAFTYDTTNEALVHGFS
jgi:hypothetical protein